MRYTIEKIESGNFAGLYIIRFRGIIGSLIGSWNSVNDIAQRVERGEINV